MEYYSAMERGKVLVHSTEVYLTKEWSQAKGPMLYGFMYMRCSEQADL